MSWLRFVLGFLFLLVSYGVHAMHTQIIKQIPLQDTANSQVRLLPPEFLKFMTFGHSSLAADLLWLQMIQYYGATGQEKSSREFLYQYFDTITSLDPAFEIAYIFASYVLTENKTQQEQALKILEKGSKNLPQSWQIPFQAGFVTYLHLKDYGRAADYFSEAATKPDAPEIAQRMAAQLNKRTNDFERCQISLRLWQDAYEKAPDQEMRERAEKGIIETRVICDLIYLQKLVEKYTEQQKQTWEAAVKAAEADNKPPPARPASFQPDSLQALVKRQMLPAFPKDPLQRDYVYDAKTGLVKVQELPWRSFELNLKNLVVKKIK